MNLRTAAACVSLVMVSGCSVGTISGAYLAKGQRFAELLQITQSKDGQLLGTLSHTGVEPNGKIEQLTFSVRGVADAHSITLLTESSVSFISGTSLSGTISGGAILLAMADGSEQFTKASAEEYQAAVQHLNEQGAAIEQRLNYEQAQANLTKHLNDQNAAVADLNKRLVEYATRVRSDKAREQDEKIFAVHSKSLARARQGWEAEQRYSKGSLQASEIYLEINQVALNLSTYDLDVEPFPEQGRGHVKGYDNEIAKSTCQTAPHPALTHCAEQPAAVQAYQAARPVVLKRMDDIEGTVKNSKTVMKNIVEQAQAYSSR